MRKNAVLALAAIYRLPKGELLVPDAPELVERMLQNEQVGKSEGQAKWACCWKQCGCSRGLQGCRQPGGWQSRHGQGPRGHKAGVRATSSAVPCLRIWQDLAVRALSCPWLQDLSTRRNAFHMLAEHAQDKAVAYLFQQIDRVADWGDILQIAVLDLIRKVGRVACDGSGLKGGLAAMS